MFCTGSYVALIFFVSSSLLPPNLAHLKKGAPCQDNVNDLLGAIQKYSQHTSGICAREKWFELILRTGAKLKYQISAPLAQCARSSLKLQPFHSSVGCQKFKIIFILIACQPVLAVSDKNCCSPIAILSSYCSCMLPPKK